MCFLLHRDWFICDPSKSGTFLFGSRVHITSVTLEHLNGAYKVEDGDGQERDPYLKEHRVITYLVVNPKVLCRFDSCTQISIEWVKLREGS